MRSAIPRTPRADGSPLAEGRAARCPTDDIRLSVRMVI